jgi:hypothetical protein
VDVSSAAPTPQLMAAAPVVVGLAFDPDGGLIVASSDAVWRLDVPLAGSAA